MRIHLTKVIRLSRAVNVPRYPARSNTPLRGPTFVKPLLLRVASSGATVLKAVIFFCLGTFFLGATSSGQTAVWGGGDGNWFPSGSSAANWYCPGPPFPCGPPNGAGWTADIGNATGSGSLTGIVTVNAPVNLTTGGVSLGTGAFGGLIVSSAANSLTANTLFLGNTGQGTLTLQSGGAATGNFVNIGAASTGNGTLTVTGLGSHFTQSNLSDGSGYLTIGNIGEGTLTISNGGQVKNAASAALGYALSTARGTANVSGVGSVWNNSGQLDVGYYGNGILNITGGGTVDDGGCVNCSASVVGYQTSGQGSVLVSGSGSTWNNNGVVNIGYQGNGALTISNGGVVNNTACSGVRDC